MQASKLELIQVTLKAPKMGCGTHVNCKVPFRIIPYCLDFLTIKKKNVREKKQKESTGEISKRRFLRRLWRLALSCPVLTHP